MEEEGTEIYHESKIVKVGCSRSSDCSSQRSDITKLVCVVEVNYLNWTFGIEPSNSG